MEDFINRLNDWHWGPFEFLRPPKEVNIGLNRFLLVCALAVPATMAGVFVASTLVIFYLSHFDFHRLPTLLQYEAATHVFLRQLWWALVAGAIWFPLGFWPCVLCWNRRAARLRQPSPPPPTEQEGVWPPAPKRA